MIVHLEPAQRPAIDVFAFRALPLLSAGSLVTVLLTSTVANEFTWLPPNATAAAWWIYAVVLITLAVRPTARLHHIGLQLAAFVYFSRGLAFAEIVLTASRWDLLGAVTERLMLLTFAIVWHLRGAQRELVAEALRKRPA